MGGHSSPAAAAAGDTSGPAAGAGAAPADADAVGAGAGAVGAAAAAGAWAFPGVSDTCTPWPEVTSTGLQLLPQLEDSKSFGPAGLPAGASS